jgi:hypothetical protein
MFNMNTLVIPDGYKLVPIQPTEQQISVGKRCVPHFDNIKRRYVAMVNEALTDFDVVERHVVVNDVVKSLFDGYVAAVVTVLTSKLSDTYTKEHLRQDVSVYLRDVPVIKAYIESSAASVEIEANVTRIVSDALDYVQGAAQ